MYIAELLPLTPSTTNGRRQWQWVQWVECILAGSGYAASSESPGSINVLFSSSIGHARLMIEGKVTSLQKLQEIIQSYQPRCDSVGGTFPARPPQICRQGHANAGYFFVFFLSPLQDENVAMVCGYDCTATVAMFIEETRIGILVDEPRNRN